MFNFLLPPKKNGKSHTFPISPLHTCQITIHPLFLLLTPNPPNTPSHIVKLYTIFFVEQKSFGLFSWVFFFFCPNCIYRFVFHYLCEALAHFTWEGGWEELAHFTCCTIFSQKTKKCLLLSYTTVDNFWIVCCSTFTCRAVLSLYSITHNFQPTLMYLFATFALIGRGGGGVGPWG